MLTVPHRVGRDSDPAHRTPKATSEDQDAPTRPLQNRNAYLNAARLACQLPNELLVQIFTIYGQMCSSYRVFAGYGWIELLLVCKHWYNIACATPKLWRNITIIPRDTKWVTLCLTRSAAAQIDVVLDPKTMLSEVYAMLSQNLHRVRRLALMRVSQCWSSQFPALLHRAARSLETLLVIHDSATFTADVKPEVNIDLTAELFPRLRRLEIAFIQAPQDIALYSNLRILRLHGCTYAGTFQDFVMSIRSAPRLTYVALNQFLSQFPVNQVSLSIPPAYSNPCLQLTQLNVRHSSVKHISSFISHINFTTKYLSLEGECLPYDGNVPRAPATVLDLLPTTGPDDSYLPSLERAKTATLRAAHGSFTLTVGEGTELPDLMHLALHSLPFSEPSLATGLFALTRVLRPAGDYLVQLSVYGLHEGAFAADWAAVFRTLTVLEEIELDDRESSAEFWLGLEAASRESETTVAGDRSPLTCRWLRSVVYFMESDMDEATLVAAVGCLEYREMRGAAALEELDMWYRSYTAGLSDSTDAELEMLEERYLPRLRELVEGSVSLNVQHYYSAVSPDSSDS